MFLYPSKAITYKNIDKFSYELYTDMSINMLKYNNDSSSIIRVLDAITASSREMLDDLPYLSVFSVHNKNFKQIDRINKFNLDNVDEIDIEKNGETTICYSQLEGYSKYTGQSYQLKHIKDKNEFLRHSFPCDCFVSGETDVSNKVFLSLLPNIWTNVNNLDGLYVGGSRVTIKPNGMMDKSIVAGTEYVITVLIEGLNIRNEIVEDRIDMQLVSEFVSNEEFIFVTRVKVLNTLVNFDIILYPYLNGKEVIWDRVVVDREEFDRRNAVVKYNATKKRLEWGQIFYESISFPLPTEIVKFVYTSGLENETVIDHFIDQQNCMFFAITASNKLFCYPFIIPKAVNSNLDNIKTAYQACKIQYIEDALNEKYVFEIFPASKNIDVDSLDIYVNGTLVHEGLILDLIREKMIDNVTEFTFEELYSSSDEALIEFRIYGEQTSIFPVYLKKPQVTPLYIKDLSDTTFSSDPSYEYSLPVEASTQIEYPTGPTVLISETSRVCKLTKHGNVIVDSALINEVYNSFYYIESENAIVTHDSIGGIKCQ